MTADELRALQAPLKTQYKNDPQSAVITMRASGVLDPSKVVCHVTTAQGVEPAGLHSAAGGSGRELCSGDMLLEALVACAGVTLRAVATALGVELGQTSVRAEGELDFRGTLGVAKDAPVGFRAIRLIYELDPTLELPEAKLEQLLRLSERYCVVYQSLKAGVPIQVAVAPR